MDTNWWVLIGQLLVLAGIIVTVVWGSRHQRKQPRKDEAEAGHTDVDSDRLRQTIEAMNERSNMRRDERLAQFHGYLLQDFEWHLLVLTNERQMLAVVQELCQMVDDLGGDTSHIVMPLPVPAPPPVPKAPPITD